MNKKIIKILIIALMLLIVFSINAKTKAVNLNVNVKTQDFLYNLDKRGDLKTRSNFGVGEDIVFTVSWDKEMQACGFEIECEHAIEVEEHGQENDGRLIFTGASIDEQFYQVNQYIDSKGVSHVNIKVEWASFDEEDRTSIDFIFKSYMKGLISFSVKNVTAFANGNLEIPETYNLYNADTLAYVDYFGDLDEDGRVGPDDYSILKSYLTTENEQDGPILKRIKIYGDLNIDGKIDMTDLDLIGYAEKDSKVELPVIYGDINRDGKINVKDLNLVNQYILGEQGSLGTISKFLSANVNNDDVVNKIDLYILQREISLNYFEFIPIFGDMNNDGRVTTEDEKVYVSYIEKERNLSMHQELVGDLNMDNVVDENDYRILQSYNDGKIDSLPVLDNSVLRLKKEKEADKIYYSGVEMKDGKVTLYDFIKKYVEGNLNIVLVDKAGNKLSEKDYVGTGAKIYAVDESHEEELGSLIIYGDTTGDGAIDAVDALALIKHINNKILFTDSAFEKAGRILTISDKKPTAVDALAIIKHANGKYVINQNKVN